MKTSIGIVAGFIFLIIANILFSEEKERHQHEFKECQYGECIMCETTEMQVTFNGEHFESRQSIRYFAGDPELNK
jgi:hypothetical protein